MLAEQFNFTYEKFALEEAEAKFDAEKETLDTVLITLVCCKIIIGTSL